MPIFASRSLIICLLLLPFVQFAEASESYKNRYSQNFSDINQHLRATISYLRTQNVDIAALEMELLRDKWGALANGLQHPNAKFKSKLDQGPATISRALLLIDQNQPKEARQLLLGLRKSFWDYHSEINLDLFDDCIFSANQVGLGLWIYRRPRPNLEVEKVVNSIMQVSREYELALRKCDRQAPASLKEQSEYQRLFQNAFQSLSKIPDTLKNKDNGQLFRYLIELRSIDRLLYFRFG